MEKEDKVAFIVISIIFCIIIFGLMWGVKITGSTLFGLFESANNTGVGFKNALITGVSLSVGIVVLFALVAGDGIIGELPTMVLSFFAFTVFFTFSVAWIF